MGFDIKTVIVAAALMACHALCLILWIAGWATSKQLDGRDTGSGNSGNPSRYYFVWGLFMSLTIMGLTVVATFVPWPLVKKITSLAIVYFIILFAIPLSVVMGQSSSQLVTDDCGDLQGDFKDLCNGYKLVFVSSFFYMFVLAGKFIFGLVLSQSEAAQGGDSSYRQSFDRT